MLSDLDRVSHREGHITRRGVMSNLTVRELQQAEWSRWDDWLALQPWGSPFSSAWWLDANCRAFGGHPLLLGVFDGEQLVGGVTLHIVGAGPARVVRPRILYNPIVIAAESTQTRQRVLTALLEDIARRKLIVRPLTCTTDMVDLRQAVWHHWDLTAGWTVVIPLKTWTLEKDISGGELKQMKRAQRANITARMEPPDADILYDLMQATMTRHGEEESLTREQLRTLVKAAGSHGMQTVVRGADGVPFSAAFVMAHGTRVAYGIWAGTSVLGLAQGAAVARDSFRLKELQSMGYEYFDWCGANLPGVSDFKLKFGGTLTTCLSISREPGWFKAVLAGYQGVKRVYGYLRRGRRGDKS